MIEILKTSRVLILFYRLMQGEKISKRRFMNEFKIGERSFERDIQEVRTLLIECYAPLEVCYDRSTKKYFMNGIFKPRLREHDVLPLIFLLVGSRAFMRNEMSNMLEILTSILPRNERREVENIVFNLRQNYEEPEHKKFLLKPIWDAIICIRAKRNVQMIYSQEEKIVMPIQVFYSEGYFYLVAKENSAEPKLYRLDKIEVFKIL